MGAIKEVICDKYFIKTTNSFSSTIKQDNKAYAKRTGKKI